MDPELKQWLLALIPALVPTLAVLFAMVQNNRSVDSLRREMESRFDGVHREMESRFGGVHREMESRFDDVNQRFDDMRDLWRAELHRVEEVLDARLKHLEHQD